jgi:sugar/nucleoside kinase (ribokinase family)
MNELDVLAIGTALVELTPRQLGVDLVHADHYDALPSGATSNFCLALARLGMKVGLATRVGDDELGQWLLHKLNGFGVDTAAARAVPGHYTPVSFCWMNQSGEKTFYFYRFPGHCDPMQEFGCEPLSDDELRRARLFDFSEATIRAEPLRSITFDLARRAQALGLQVAYAMNYRPSQWCESPDQVIAIQRQALALADIALMNAEEAELVAGSARRELLALGPTIIAITAGAAGATVLTPDGEQHVSAPEVEVHYDIGAGDTFHAGFIAGLLRGYDPVMATRIGSAAAALRISREADMRSLPTWDETLVMAENDGPTLEGAPL